MKRFKFFLCRFNSALISAGVSGIGIDADVELPRSLPLRDNASVSLDSDVTFSSSSVEVVAVAVVTLVVAVFALFFFFCFFFADFVVPCCVCCSSAIPIVRNSFGDCFDLPSIKESSIKPCIN
jgi:hypothetical protein